MQLRDALIRQAPSQGLQIAAAAEISRLDTIEAAARHLLTAFERLGESRDPGALLIARAGCECAALALEAAVRTGQARGAA